MSTISKFKWFWAWNDEKEETWLGEMSRAGFHLQSVTLPGKYIFEAGKSKEYVYRLDFLRNKKDYVDYLQLFEDAGWEHLFEYGGWQYFRTEATTGKDLEIFTDNESKIAKYGRVMGLMFPFFPIYIILLNNLNEAEGLFYEIATFIFFLIMVLFAFAMIMLFRRIGQLKKKI